MAKKIFLPGFDIIESPDPDGPFTRRKETDAQHPWEDEVFVQGGETGIVFKGNQTYTTAFVEVFINGAFIRGEGSTLYEAETACWNKYVAQKSCVQHEWETRGRTNGSGSCKHCDSYAVNVFSLEELGSVCSVCGIGTNYNVQDGIRFCENHDPFRAERNEWFTLMDQMNTGDESDATRARVKELGKILNGTF